MAAMIQCKCGKTYSKGYIEANDTTVHTMDGWKVKFLLVSRNGKVFALNGCPECINPTKLGGK